MSTQSVRPARISVVVNTLNEERRLSFALRSVQRWTHEIVVVDMQSEDRTREVAESFGARVYSHPRVGFADPARAFALSKASGDWILVLDADELIPPRLARRLREIADASDFDVVDVPFVNYLLGAPLDWTGWGSTQDHHRRFFRKGWVEATDDIHDFLHPREGARVLRLAPEVGTAFIHFNYTDVSHFIEKLDRYTSIEAERVAASPRSRLRVLTSTVREFFDRYVRYGGYRDGWRGFYLAGLMAFYRFAVHAKVQQLKTVGTGSDVQRRYEAEAERWLSDLGEGT